MPVDELVAMLPALGVVLPSGASLQGGTLSTSLDISGAVDKLVINGPIRLADTKLANFDLGSKLSAVAALAGIKTGTDTVIQNFSSSVRAAPEGIRAEQIDLLVPSLGEVTGSGTVSPSNALDFKMVAKLASGNAVGQLSTIVLGGNRNGVPFFIRGTTSNPVFQPDLKGLVGGKVGGLPSIPGNPANPTQNPVDTLQNLFKKKKPK
jgi:AsmA protein